MIALTLTDPKSIRRFVFTIIVMFICMGASHVTFGEFYLPTVQALLLMIVQGLRASTGSERSRTTAF